MVLDQLQYSKAIRYERINAKGQKVMILNKNKFIALFKNLVLREIGLVFGLFVLFQIILWLFPHHEYTWLLAKLVLVISATKIVYILFYSISKLRVTLACCYSFNDILYVYTLILGILIVSFAADYYCLKSCMSESFLFTNQVDGSIAQAFDLLYFSIVTFATIGYGDIVPLTFEAKMLVIFEIISSFIMITFVISNIGRSDPLSQKKPIQTYLKKK